MGYSQGDYRPCECGSGQKYKFCCRSKDQGRRRFVGSHTTRLQGGGEDIIFADLAEGERLAQRGKGLVEANRPDEAIPALEKAIREAPFIAMPYNNLALAYFVKGNVEKAFEVQRQVVDVIAPDNAFALGGFIHYALVLGRRGDALAAADRLERLAPADEWGAHKKAEALARLGRHEAVRSAARAGLALAKEEGAGLAFFAGVACLNLGECAEGESYLRQARAHKAFGQRAARYLKLLEQKKGPGTFDGVWPYLDPTQWLSPALVERIWDAARRGDADFHEWRRHGAALVEVAAGMLNDDPASAEDGIRFLKATRAPEAVEILKKVASGTWGTDQIRLNAFLALVERGEVPLHQPFKIFLKGSWGEVQPLRTEVTEDAVRPLPAEAQGLAAEAMEATHRADWKRAEKINREIIRRAPKAPAAYHNLAVALIEQGRQVEGEEWLQKAREVDPAYLFAPATLASLRAREGRIQDAREILKACRIPSLVHPTAYAYFLAIQGHVASLEGDVEAFERALRMAEDLDPDLPLVKRFSKEARATTGLTGLARRFRHWIGGRRKPRPESVGPLGPWSSKS